MVLFGQSPESELPASAEPLLTAKEADALMKEEQPVIEIPPTGPEPLVIVNEAERVLVEDDERALKELEATIL